MNFATARDTVAGKVRHGTTGRKSLGIAADSLSASARFIGR
jgi:hypothetical protein